MLSRSAIPRLGWGRRSTGPNLSVVAVSGGRGEEAEMAMGADVVRIAAVSDIHYSRDSHGALQPLFAQITESADVLVLAGDLTDYGLAEEAKLLARDLTTTVKIPIVAVLGNHDYESGEEEDLVRILSDAGVKMLDGDTFETHGVGFAGIRGFCGGFGTRGVRPRGGADT